MTTMARLGFDIETRSVKGASRDLDAMSKSADRATKSQSQFASAANLARTAVGGLVASLGVRQILGYADAWQNLSNQLRQVTTGSIQLADVQNRIVAVSKDTRSNVESTANLYARLARSTTEMGLSTEDLIGLTKTINQSFIVSGASAQEAAAAITQLSQGLASGALRGDEFNSVSEQAPALMRAISDSLGLTIGELRKFASEGGITAQIVVDALRKASDEIDHNFSKTVDTFGQNMETANANMLAWVGSSQAITSTTSIFGAAVVKISENIDTLVNVVGVAALIWAGKMAGAAYINAHAFTLAAAAAVRNQLAIATMTGATTAASVAMVGMSYAATAARGAMAMLGGPAGMITIAAVALYYFATRATTAEKEAKALDTRIQELSGSFDTLGRAQAKAALIDYTKKLDQLTTAAAAARKEAENYAIIAKSYSGSDGVLFSEKAVRAAANYEKLTGEIEATNKAIAQLNKIAAGGNDKSASGGVQKASEDAQKMAISLEEAHLKLKLGERAFLQYKLAAAGATDQQTKFALASYDAVKNLEDAAAAAEELKEKQKAALAKLHDGVKSQSQRVADSLQDAITQGDWAGIGATIGATLASGIAIAVGQSFVIDSIASAVAVPLLGAIAGGVVGMAANKVGKYFSDSYDPTASRQSSQGTGTVLGSIYAKSQSIARASDITSRATSELVGINRAMLNAIESVNRGIIGASGMIARSRSGMSIGYAGGSVMGGGEVLSSGLGALSGFGVGGLLGANIGGKLGSAMSGIGTTYLDFLSTSLTLGVVDFGKMLGGSSKKRDEGIEIIGGTLAEMMDNTIVNAYETYRVKSTALSKSKTSEVSASLGRGISRQFSEVLSDVYKSVVAGAGALGIGISDETMRKFKVATAKLSLEGLDAAAQQAAIQEYFGTVFDNLAKHTVPWLVEMQRAGEGLGETLARVATNVQVTEEAVKMMGVGFVVAVPQMTARDRMLNRLTSLASRFGISLEHVSKTMEKATAEAATRLIDLSGGIEQFTASMGSFIGNFATEAQQFEINQGALNRALADAKLPLADSRAGYWALMQAQDASTKKGAQNIATLLRLQGAADAYYSTLEKKQKETNDAQLRAQQTALDVALSNAAAVNRALGGLNVQDAAASRESALAAIREMTRTGNIGDNLQDTLASATAINAADFATFNDYVRAVARTGEALGGLKGVTDAKVTREQELLAGIERRIEAMAEELANIGRANAKHTSKTAAILERMELDGIDIREVENA